MQLLQRRINGDIDFHLKTFWDYENGFGSLQGEYWMGMCKQLQEFVFYAGARVKILSSARNQIRNKS